MTYKELKKEDYSFVIYSQFVATCVLYKRKPFRVLQYRTDSKTVTFIIFSETRSGSMVTRHVTLPEADGVFFRAWLASDFPEMEIELIENPEDIEE